MIRQSFLDCFSHVADAPGGMDMLRRLVLDLAVRGQLTHHDPDDEPATKLLKRIASERDGIVKATAIRKPLKPLDSDDAKALILPDGWTRRPLTAVAEVRLGRQRSPKNHSGKQMRLYIRAANVTWTGLDLSDVMEMNFTDAEMEIYRLQSGDIVLSEASGSPGGVGKPAMWNNELGECAFQNTLIRVRPFAVDSTYLLLYFRAQVLLGKFVPEARGMGINHLGRAKLASWEVPIPPLLEQHRIVERVNELMAMCDHLEEQRATRVRVRSALTAATFHRVTDAGTTDDLRAAIGAFAERIDLHLAPGEGDLGALKRLRQAVLDLAVRGRLTHQDPADTPATELLKGAKLDRDRRVAAKEVRKSALVPAPLTYAGVDTVPSGWSPVLLGALGAWGSGATPNRSTSAYYGGDISWLKSGELNDGYVSSSAETITDLALQETSVKLRQPGDVLIAMYGATIGRTAILGFEATTNQAVCACRPYAGIYNRFLHLLLMSMRGAFVGLGAGGAQPNISKEKIEAQVISLPPHAEQVRIVERVDELMVACDELEQQLVEARSARADMAASIAASASPHEAA